MDQDKRRKKRKADTTKVEATPQSKMREALVYLVSFIIVGIVALSIYKVRVNIAEKKYEEQLALEQQAWEEEQARLEELAKQQAEISKETGTEGLGDPEEELTVVITEEEMQVLLAGIKLTTETGTTVDFAHLQQMNPDVYAWISVPGTKIEYPILQHPTDNTYYLYYNIDGSKGYPGCIYTENFNKKDFTDPNTVIYGHNMKNGSMFAGLHKFEDSKFFDEHDQVIIYTPGRTYQYKIFAAYVYDDRHIMRSFDFNDPNVYEQYLKEIFLRRDMGTHLRKDVTVTKDDKIITLATCMAKQPDRRLLVQAVLVNE